MKIEIDFGNDSPQEIIETLKLAEWRLNGARIGDSKKLAMVAHLKKIRDAVEAHRPVLSYREQYLPKTNVFSQKDADAIYQDSLSGHGGAKFDG